MEESTFKRQKVSAAEENKDRISSLSDCMLSHILSFLPTKTSVGTSILSRRWRRIWQHLTVLDLSDDSFDLNDEFIDDMDKRYELFQTFSFFVNNVFSLRRPYSIRSMRISCTKSLVDDKICNYSINKWLNSVIGPHLKELELLLYSMDDYYFDLPIALSACTNLVSLSLDGAIYIEKEIFLPSLKNLKLDIGYMHISFINALLSSCPILEILYTYLGVEDYAEIILPPTLKRLHNKTFSINDEPSLEINALVFDCLNKFSDVGNLQNIVKASVDIFPSSGYSTLALHLPKLLSALSGIKHLALSPSTTKLLMGDAGDPCLPEFCNLLHVELILPLFNSNSLLILLQKCPMLQVLKIQNNMEQPPLPISATHPIVPSCLVSHLTFIQLNGYQGFPDELIFVEYILQNGLVLKTMIIADISVDMRKKCDILKRLSNVARASEVCQLIFEGDV